MTNRRPRGRCPKCGRDVALTATTQVISFHRDPTDRSQGYRCDGVGSLPNPEPAVVRMSELINNLEQHIEARALELIAASEQPITAVLQALAERYPEQVAAWVDSLLERRS